MNGQERGERGRGMFDVEGVYVQREFLSVSSSTRIDTWP